LHNFLRTVEDIYGANHAAAAANVKSVTGPFVTDAPAVIKTFREGQNTYSGAHDTQDRNSQPTTIFGATTLLASTLDTGTGTAGNQPIQALVRFDNVFGSAAGQVPTGATISSAK